MAETPQRLKELRKEKNITLKEMSKKVGINISTISNYENGYSIPKPDKLKVLAKFYGVSESYILGYTSDKEGLLALFPEYSDQKKATNEYVINQARNDIIINFGVDMVEKIENSFSDKDTLKKFYNMLAIMPYSIYAQMVLYTQILNKENLEKVFEYAKLLIESQEKEDKEL